MELLVPYRDSSVSKVRRWLNNISLTLFNSVSLNMIFSAHIVSTLTYVQTYKSDILNLVLTPSWLNILFMVAFMDFMLYIWHLLNHKIPLLWRFHRGHHSDLKIDVWTGTRFHIGELVISAIIKISIIFFLGASPLGVLIFESALVLCTQFHHSSLKIPKWFETIFWIFFVPPSMHRIHHSVVIKERDSNYGTIFSLWDRLLGTILTSVDQARIRIGVGAYHYLSRLNFHQLLVMPFTMSVR